ncbi:MAG: hypothetical protein ACXV5H_06585 [Halobacteriota archaeon]
MQARLSFKEQQDAIKDLGACLKGGLLIENPFDMPMEMEQQGDIDKSVDDATFFGIEPSVACEKLPGAKKDISAIDFQQRLRFFLDGSLRTKFIGEYVHGATSFPILTTDILSAVIDKQGRSLLPYHIEKRVVFIFPQESELPSTEIIEQLKQLNGRWIADGINFRVAFLLADEARGGDTRHSMQGKARACMHSLEHFVAVNKIERGGDWLVMDGAIRKAEFLRLENTIGVAKSFSLNPRFDLGGNEETLSITSYLSRIGVGYRSAVFVKDRDVAFWYIRLRNFPPMEPLGGIIKVDFNLRGQAISKEGLLSEQTVRLVDEISAELFANRTPSIYPYPRWPSFLYPIRITEQMMRSNYSNINVLGYYARQLKQAIGEV